MTFQALILKVISLDKKMNEQVRQIEALTEQVNSLIEATTPIDEPDDGKKGKKRKQPKEVEM